MKTLDMMFVAAFLCGGCASTSRLSSPEDVNRRIGGGTATVISSSGEECNARDIQVRSDSTFFVDEGTGKARQITTRDVRSFQLSSRWGGALEGLFFGGLAGGAAGYAIGSSTSRGDMREMGVGLLTFGGIVFGGVGGLIIGVLRGHQFTVVLDPDSLTPPEAAQPAGRSD